MRCLNQVRIFGSLLRSTFATLKESKKGTFSMLFGTAVAVRRMIGSDSFGFDRQGTEHGEVDA